MVYARKRSMAMGPYGARSYKKARTSYSQKARSAYVRKTAKAVVTRMAEKKTHLSVTAERSLSTLTPGASADWLDLSAVPSGDNFYQRDGRQITCQRLEMKGHMINNGSQVTLARMVVGWVKNQTAVSNTLEIFESATPAGTAAGVDQLEVLYRRFNKTTFSPIFDKVYTLGATNNTNGDSVATFNVNIALRGKKINFEGTGVAAGDQDYKLYAIIFAKRADDDDISGNVVEWTCYSNLDFLDI